MDVSVDHESLRGRATVSGLGFSATRHFSVEFWPSFVRSSLTAYHDQTLFMAKTKRKPNGIKGHRLIVKGAWMSPPCCFTEAEDESISKGVLPIELTHSIIAQALGNYYTDLILYEGSNTSANGESDVPFALLHA